jgi:pimeloyl-ACP methyl ester carboxylesterase
MPATFSSLPATAAERFDVPVEDGVTIAAYELHEGSANTPVLVWGHANGFGAGSYLPFLRRLTTHFRIFAYDARGQGGSSTPPEPYTSTICFDRFARDLEAVVYRVQARAPKAPLYYGGHSFSAAGMFHLGGNFGFAPWRAVTTFDATLRPSDRGDLRQISKARSSPLAEMTLRRRRYFDTPADYATAMARPKAFGYFTPEMLDALCQATIRPRCNGLEGYELSCSPEIEAATYNSVAATTAPYDGLMDFPVSAHLIAADPAVPNSNWIAEVQFDVARHLPDARVTTMKGAGHLMPFERPDECAKIILAMLAKPPTMRKG